ncbi:hypothetical protein HL42_2031 [Trichophyton rubrum]|nr:hypothetical protein HL42_2031 [Trichophyton rubrum]
MDTTASGIFMLQDPSESRDICRWPPFHYTELQERLPWQKFRQLSADLIGLGGCASCTHNQTPAATETCFKGTLSYEPELLDSMLKTVLLSRPIAILKYTKLSAERCQSTGNATLSASQ